MFRMGWNTKRYRNYPQITLAQHHISSELGMAKEMNAVLEPHVLCAPCDGALGHEETTVLVEGLVAADAGTAILLCKLPSSLFPDVLHLSFAGTHEITELLNGVSRHILSIPNIETNNLQGFLTRCSLLGPFDKIQDDPLVLQRGLISFNKGKMFIDLR
jgi:hypothetical protein